MDPTHNPPIILNRILKWHTNRELLEEIQGDLEEEYNDIYKNKGKLRANTFYLIEVIRFMRMFDADRKYKSSNHLSMIKSNLKLASRNLLKHKMYSLINISGLAIGMACAFLIFLFIKVETGYDKFHENGKNIYRMQHRYGFIGAPVGQAYVDGYAQVKDFVRINPWYNDSRIKSGEKSYYEDLIFADSNFFTFFSFPFVKGDPLTCLSTTDKIVITQSTAEKYFGNEDPVGQLIEAPGIFYNTDLLFKVSAVIQDVPYNSHLQFDMVSSFDLMKKNQSVAPILDKWENDWVATYLLMDPNVNTIALKDDFENFTKNFEGAENGGPYDFMPLEDLRLESYHLQNDYTEHGNGSQVKIFTAIAIMILLIGCINFTNLATARASKRSKEVGIRKTLGALRTHLIYQFFSESALMTFIALLVAVTLLFFAVPFVENLGDVNLINGLDDYSYIITLVLSVVFGTIIMAGAYPALFLSSFQPATILNDFKHSGKATSWIRKSLVVFQFVISTVLIVGSLIIYDQMSFIKNKDLGFKPDHVIRFDFGNRRDLHSKWPMIEAEIERQSGVKSSFTTGMVPGDNAYYWGYKFEGYTENPTGEGWLGYYLGPDVLRELDVDVILGRTFSSDMPSDSNAFVLNESAWKKAIESYGDDWKEPIGRRIEYYTTNSGQWALDKSGPVIGVVKDFHHHSLKSPIEPIVMHNFKGSNILVKTARENAMEVVAYVQDHWEGWGSRTPFKYEFVEDRFNAHYDSEQRFGDFMLIFCLLAIFIACLGLYGLAAYTAEQRIKEIGIRKVLGASVKQIIGMLSMDFLKLVAMSVVISIPIAIYAMNKWLENFSYRVTLEWYHLLAGAIIATWIALLTVSSNSLKAANSNPVNSLRNE